jgi:hypothetical protein
MKLYDAYLSLDPLYPLSPSDMELLWMYREHYRHDPKGLSKFLSSVPFNEMLAVQEMHKYLKLWAPLVPIDALEVFCTIFCHGILCSSRSS